MKKGRFVYRERSHFTLVHESSYYTQLITSVIVKMYRKLADLYNVAGCGGQAFTMMSLFNLRYILMDLPVKLHSSPSVGFFTHATWLHRNGRKRELGVFLRTTKETVDATGDTFLSRERTQVPIYVYVGVCKSCPAGASAKKTIEANLYDK